MPLIREHLPKPDSDNQHHHQALPTASSTASKRIPPHQSTTPNDERSYLLSASPSSGKKGTEPTSCWSSTSSILSPDQSGHRDRVYPWTSYQSVATPSSQLALPANNVNSASSDGPATKILHALVEYKQTQTFTRLLAKAHSMSSSSRSTSPSPQLGAASSHTILNSNQRRRHSILRVNSSASLIGKPLRKSASVEFALHDGELHKLAPEDRRSTVPSDMPRRLTVEEKEELYKVRPDLEIGPSPFYTQQLKEMEQRNQRRIVFAVVGGMMCIMFLLVVYYMVTIA